jgi:hypothetical protein
LIVWSLAAYAFVFVFAGANVCSILQPVPNVAGATPMPIDYAAAAARCNRPDVGAIIASVVGYGVIAAAAIATRPGRREPADES